MHFSRGVNLIKSGQPMASLLRNKEALGKELVARAYLRGDFMLSSGKRSNYFFDKYLFETEPELLDAVTRYLSEMLPAGTNKLAGVELGAVPLITALSLKTYIPFVIVRKVQKSHGTARLIEGKLNGGETVVLVEDVVTSGQQALNAVKILEEAGGKVLKVICVVDREEGGRANIESEGLTFESLFTKTSLGV